MEHYKKILKDPELLEFIDYIVEQLMEKYDFSKEEAREQLFKSSFVKILANDEDYVFHYSPLHWADRIANERLMMAVFVN